MKQKRKVKSLIPKKQEGQTYFITTILLILSLVLCIWTAALITSFVWASDNEESETVYKEFEYTWIDDNKETVYGIKFVDPSNMRKITNNIFVQSGNLYISPNPVVVNPIKSDGKSIDRNVNLLSWVYPHIKNSHILWWKNNKMYWVSDSSPENIVLIGWEGNIISSSNKNTVILGWSWNYVDQQYDTNRDPSAVLIWWQNNSVASAHHGPILIWWKNNYVEEHSTQTAILWWENNRVEAHWGGRIIWWKNVIVTGASDIFTYSNSDETFTPQTSNAFYLNMKKWVWVNTTWEDKWLFVDEAVKIDMDNWNNRSEPCNEDNYWVIVAYRWCIIGCTKAWKEQGGKWELLDEWADCKSLLKNSSKVITNPDSSQQNQIKTTTYDAQCTNNIDTWHSTICSNNSNYTGGYLEFYKNVIFETTLLDSDQPCPEWQENQCIYKCDPDYHLTWNAADGTLKCHKDCVVPRDETKKMTHNQTIVWYNITWVSCSNDIYVFPFETDIINKWKPLANPLYTKWNPVINGVTYKNKARNGRSPETCGNYDHKKTLICNEWDWYLVGTNWKADLSTSGAAAKYKYGSCNIGNYACASSVLETNPCITAEDMYDCIENGGCDRNIYDLNHDKNLDTADVTAINNAALQNKCYTQESATIIIDECVKTKDIYNCINNGGCDRKIYDVDWNWHINTSDVTTVNNATLQHKCYMKKYEYTQESISSQLQDSLIIYWNQVLDRSTFEGERWRYKACYSYTTAWESCNVSEYRYDFLGCKTESGYDMVDGICKKQCRLSWVPYKHGNVAIWYKSSSETCTGTCQSATLLCNDGTWIHKSTLGTNSCITTDDVYNCIKNERCDVNVYDVNEDENLDTADIVVINNLAKENKCYMRRSSLIDNPCVTINDIYNCIKNGCTDKDKYDVNGDWKINTADVNAINNAAGSYKCYMKNRTTNTTEANPCTMEKDIYNCITNGNCGMAYDVNWDWKLNTADVVEVNQKAANGQCFKKEVNIETNPCITDNDIDNCIKNWGCNKNIYDVNGDWNINTADKVAIYNAASKHKCYYAGTNSEANINVEEYLNGNCTLRNKTCDSSYNVTYDVYLSWKDHGTYLACESYTANGQFVCTFTDIKYKLTACVSWYHTEDGKICESNVKTWNCTKWDGGHAYRYRSIESNIENYPRFVELGSKPISLPVWQYITRWTWEWNNGYWTWIYPEVACDWSCESGYRKSWNRCVDTQCSRWDKPTWSESDGVIKWNTHPSGNSDLEWSYTTGKNLWDCQWSCKEDYHRKPNTNTCEFNEKTVRCITGWVIPENSDYVITWVTVTWDSTWNKWGDIDPCDWKCNEPDYILNEAHTGCILKPSCPAWKYLDEENHCEFTPPWTYSPDGDINKYNCPAWKHSNAAATSAEECWSYADLDVYIVWPDSGVKSYSLMDRNLWATEIYNWDIDHPNVASYGYHYQWWNNYGFLPCTTNWCTEFPNGESSSASPVSDPDPKYIPSKYINNVYITADNYLTNWNNNSNQWYNRVKNLWWGADSSYLLKQWPCPLGYHVPSQWDLKDLVSSWRLANNLGSDNQDLLELLDYDYNKSQSMIDEGDINFMKDFIIPPAWERNIYTYHVSQLWNEYWLWSSSIEVLEGNVHNVYLWGIDINKPLFHHIANSVRCIKNTKNNRTTIEPNWGTWAVISIVWWKIHSLWTPSKEGKIFQWWYADPSFTQKVQTWSQATQNLYAKWESESVEESVTYLLPWPDINQSMIGVTTSANRDNIKYFKRSTVDKHEDYVAFDEIQIPDNWYPEVYLWYDPDDKTIYYYTDATTIYMNPDSSRMFHGFGDADTDHFDYWRLEDIDLSDINTSMVENMSRMFELCGNLKSIKLWPDFDTSIVTDMSYMFRSCSSLTNTGLDLSKFDTRSVVDMSSMFAWCSSMKHLNLSQYDNFKTDNVIDMNSMFSGGPELTCNSLSKFNTSKVKNMLQMFKGTPSKSLDLTSFDTSEVTEMSSMFENSDLTSVDLTSFDTNKVYRMNHMFEYSEDLMTIYASNNFTINLISTQEPATEYEPYREYNQCWNGTDDGCRTNNMFAKCNKLSTPYHTTPILQCDSVFNTSCQWAWHAHVGTAGENPHYIWYFTAKDDSLGDFCKWAEDNSARLVEWYEINRKMVGLAGGEENIEYFYYENLDINPLPSWTTTEAISVSWSRRDVIIWYDSEDKTIYYYTKADKIYMNSDSSRMFEWLYNLSGIDIYANDESYVKWDTSKVKNMSRMFKDCESLADRIWPLWTWDTSSVEDMSSMFAWCYKLQELSPLETWNTSSVEDMSSMFSHCDEYKNCTSDSMINISPLSNWNTSSVEDMSSMFEWFSFHSDDGIDPLSGWNTSSVEDMSYMFYASNNVYDVDALSNWDTSSVKDMSHMFENCLSLSIVHLEWNTSNVENMNWMFQWCDLDEVATQTTPDNWVLLSGWDTSKVKDMSKMFSSNRDLQYVELNGWNTSSVEDMSSMFFWTDIEEIYWIENRDTSKVKNMSAMFAFIGGCVANNQNGIWYLNLPWETDNVTDMSSMFANTNIKTLNLSTWNTSSVENMYHMFINDSTCAFVSPLTTIYASDYFVTDNVSNSDNMFAGAENLMWWYGTVYDSSHIDKEYARIDKVWQKWYFTYKTPTPIDWVCGTRPYTCESWKLDFSNYDGPVLNRYYTVWETPYISWYQWDCNWKFNWENAIWCVTCDDDNYYVRDGEKCTYKPRRYYCAVYDPLLESIKAVDVCTIKNEDNKLFCINEDNPDCDGPAYNNTCCYWEAWANYPDYVNPFPNPAGKEEVLHFWPMLEYRSLYKYFAPVKNNGEHENIIPIEFDFGIWHYWNYWVAPREMWYREQTQ